MFLREGMEDMEGMEGIESTGARSTNGGRKLFHGF